MSIGKLNFKKPKTEFMKLSIIITHHKTPEILVACLDAILKIVGSLDYEIIVSGGEVDYQKSAELNIKYQGVIFIDHKKNVGFSALVNGGIEKSSGEFVFVVNADIIFGDKSDILAMMDYLDKNNDVGIIGPRLFNLDGSIQQTYFREYSLLTILAKRTFLKRMDFSKKLLDEFMYKDKLVSVIFEPDWILGAAFMMKRENLNKIGGKLDKRYFMYFEDTDLCRTFKKSGLKVVYFPFAEFVHHHARASDRGRGIFDIVFNPLTRIHIASYLKFIWKWHVGGDENNRM